jgi:hypothetical protein
MLPLDFYFARMPNIKYGVPWFVEYRDFSAG